MKRFREWFTCRKPQKASIASDRKQAFILIRKFLETTSIDGVTKVDAWIITRLVHEKLNLASGLTYAVLQEMETLRMIEILPDNVVRILSKSDE